jgi:hypothetical protein
VELDVVLDADNSSVAFAIKSSEYLSSVEAAGGGEIGTTAWELLNVDEELEECWFTPSGSKKVSAAISLVLASILAVDGNPVGAAGVCGAAAVCTCVSAGPGTAAAIVFPLS